MKKPVLAALSLAAACSHAPDVGPVAPALDASAPAADGSTPPPGGEDGSVPGPDAGLANEDGGASSDGSAPTSCAQYLGSTPASAWVYADANGKLAYEPLDAQGDTIMDFSSAGYMGGGVAIPTVPVAKSITPSGGDDTSAIQAAIDAVSSMPLVNGVRGAVLLEAGQYTLEGSIRISASGVVLRGSGTGASGTVVNARSTVNFALRISGSGGATLGTTTAITDAYVPSGASSFGVSDASGFAVGDTVYVQRPVTSAWVAFMGMSDLVTSDGAADTWIAPGTLHQWDRTVTAVAATGSRSMRRSPIRSTRST